MPPGWQTPTFESSAGTMDLLARVLAGEFRNQPKHIFEDLRALANDRFMTEAERTARAEEVLNGWPLKQQHAAERTRLRVAPLNGHTSDADTPGDSLPQPVNWVDLFNRPITTEEWLVNDFWPAGRSISVVARVKGGKSLLMFYLAASLARGIDPWTGQPRPPVTVGYWDMEMTEDDLHERAIDFGLQPEQLEHLKYYLLPTIPPIDTPEGGRAVLDTLRRDHVQATIFDTFGRVVEGDENLADTVNAYYRWTGLPLKVEGIASARLDHVGHTNTERARGSSGKGADIDVAWTLTRSEDSTVTLDHHGVTRIRWVNRTLTVEHTEGEPDRYHRTYAAWPAGTKELGEQLDRLGVPVDASINDAVKALRNGPGGRRKDDVRAALNWRKTVGNHLGNHTSCDSSEPLWEPDAKNEF